MEINNQTVANAMAANARTASNASFDGTRKVKVVADTDTLFGKKHETKVMTLAELQDNMTKAGHGRAFIDVLRDLEAGREANPYLKMPCEAWFRWA